MRPVFLTLDEALAIHHDQLGRYGGAPGIRDLALLQFAIGAPAVTFGGKLLQQSLAEMAAAYLFHIAQNHPFVDGNKRTALASALIFLRMNDHALEVGDRELFRFVIGLASGKRTKAEASVFIAGHLVELPLD